jgi:hypothetical protein
VPNLAWLADGVDPVAARATHPVIGPLDRLIDSWCERRELSPLSYVLPSYLTGPSGFASWTQLLEALERIRSAAKVLPEFPDQDLEVVSRLIEEKERIVRIGQEE